MDNRVDDYRLQPLEAEQSVLGALLIDSKAWSQIEGRLDADDFYRPDHRAIFIAIKALVRDSHDVDLVTVSERLKRGGKVGGNEILRYCALLARDTPTAANIGSYAEVVRDRAQRRRLAELGEFLRQSAQQPGDAKACELVAEAQRRILDLHDSTRVGSGLVPSRELAATLVDELERRRESPRGLEIGLSDFDDLTGGLEAGDLVVAAARPGMGKTTLLMSIAAHTSLTCGTAIFSAEMPAQQLMRRAVSYAIGMPQGRLRRPDHFTDADWAALSPAFGDLAERKLWIDDTALPSLQHIRSETLALKARCGLGLVLVDYVQLVAGHGRNRYEELRDVSYGMKALAKELHVPVILLAQLNRGVESREQKRPQLSDLRDSGAIEEAADIVAMLYREGYYDPSFVMPEVLECRIEKHRNGERGECLWHFAGEYSRVSVLDAESRARYLQLRQRERQTQGRQSRENNL